MRAIWPLTSLLVFLCAPAGADDVMADSTRTGSVYQRISLIEGSTAMCRAMCDRDGQCRSWVWTPPGLEGADGNCALLASTPSPQPAPGRVTGLASDIATMIEAAGERAPTAREIAALRATLPGPR